MLYELELRKHRELCKLLKAVQAQLTQWKENHDQKIVSIYEITKYYFIEYSKVVGILKIYFIVEPLTFGDYDFTVKRIFRVEMY